MRRVALDLGNRKISYCEVADGKVIKRQTVSSVSTLEFELGPQQAPAVVAIEACREAWHVHDVLESWGNKVVIVDTTRVRQLGVGQHGRKTDRIDAEALALALERGGIPVAHVLSPARRELRRWLGVRRALVESRAQMVTTVRGICRELGQPLPSCMTRSFVTRVRQASVDASARAVVEPLLKTIETVNAQLEEAERRLGELRAVEPLFRLLSTAPGVATIVAAAFVSVVDEAERFLFLTMWRNDTFTTQHPVAKQRGLKLLQYKERREKERGVRRRGGCRHLDSRYRSGTARIRSGQAGQVVSAVKLLIAGASLRRVRRHKCVATRPPRTPICCQPTWLPQAWLENANSRMKASSPPRNAQ